MLKNFVTDVSLILYDCELFYETQTYKRKKNI